MHAEKCQPVDLVLSNEAKQSINIDMTPYMQFRFEQTHAGMEQVHASELGWSSMADVGSSFGYRDNALWLKTCIRSVQSQTLYLLFDYAILDFIDVYVIVEGDKKHFLTGDRIPLNDRLLEHRKLVVPIALGETQPTRLLIRVYGDSSYTVPIKLQDHVTFQRLDADQNLFLSGLFGAGIVMILLSIFLGLTLRQRAYFYYVVFTLSFTMFNFALQGYSRYYFWQDSPQLNDMLVLFWGQLGGIAYFSFLVTVLSLKKRMTRHYDICKTYVIVMSTIMLATVLGLHAQLQTTTHALNASFALYSMCLTFLAWRQGSAAAKYIFLGWVFLMTSVVIKALVATGILPYNTILFHSFDLGMTLNFVLLAFAMGYQIVDARNRERLAREDAEQARNQAIVSMEQYRALFEHAPIPMFKVNANDEFVQANRAFVDLFGFESEQSLLAACTQSKNMYKYQRDYLSIVSELRKDRIVDKEVLVQNQSEQTLWIRISVRRLIAESALIFEGACIDITAQKMQHHAEQEQHQREVKQLEALVSGVAHYLNTPLGSATTAESLISGKAEELDVELTRQRLTASRLKSFLSLVQNSAGVIKSSLQKSIQVVNRFRELKQDEGKLHITQTNAKEIGNSLRASLDKQVRDNVHIYTLVESLDEFSLPLRPLLKVLDKLTSNAYKHGHADEVTLVFQQDEQGTLIHFSDNGSGLDDDVNAKDLFAPFFAKSLSLQEVSGLDLFVVKSTIQNHLGGRVMLREEALPALHFEIWLPSFTSPEQ